MKSSSATNNTATPDLRPVREREYDAEFIALCEGRVKWMDLSPEIRGKLFQLQRVTADGKPQYYRILPDRFPWILPPTEHTRTVTPRPIQNRELEVGELGDPSPSTSK